MFFKQIHAFTVVCQDITIQLMQLKCFKTIFNQTGKRHRSISFSPVFLGSYKYPQSSPSMEWVKIKNIDCSDCNLFLNMVNHKPELACFIDILVRILQIPFKSKFGKRSNSIAYCPVGIVVFPVI